MTRFLSFAAAILVFCTLGCSTTLSTLQPAETLKQGSFHVGVAQNINIPVGRVIGVLGVGDTAAENLIKQGSSYTPTEAEQRDILDAAVGIGLNPPGATPDVMVRYGIAGGFDAGLRYSGTAIHLDAKAQFTGEAESEDDWAGAISIGYSRQRYSGLIFDVLDVLQINDYSRHNMEIPVLFGHRLSKFGHVWMGPKYIGSYYKLDASIKNIGIVPTTSGFIHYVGGFCGIALGYKYVFAMAELTIADMIAKPEIFGRPVDVGGLVVMPSLGLMARFP